MTALTPWSAALGGGLIGTAAVLLWWLNGRTAGVSGVVGGVLAPGPVIGGRGWRLLFLLGLVLDTAAWFGLSQQLPAVRSGMHPGLLIAAGLLVGYGTTTAGGFVGSALFGIGWGLAGYCPGPAIASLGFANAEALWFLPAMVAGMALRRWTTRPS